MTNGLAVTPSAKRPFPFIRSSRSRTSYRTIQSQSHEKERTTMSTIDVVATPRNTEADHVLVQEISLEQIQPSKANPRRRVDDAALTELAASIKSRGVLQPILVRPVNADGYEIVCGERRWRASRTAGKDSIPARIVNLEAESVFHASTSDIHHCAHYLKSLPAPLPAAACAP